MQEVKKYESQRTANKSTYWVIFELIWRDYYRFFTLRFGNAIFMEYGITDRKVPPFCNPDFVHDTIYGSQERLCLHINQSMNRLAGVHRCFSQHRMPSHLNVLVCRLLMPRMPPH